MVKKAVAQRIIRGHDADIMIAQQAASEETGIANMDRTDQQIAFATAELFAPAHGRGDHPHLQPRRQRPQPPHQHGHQRGAFIVVARQGHGRRGPRGIEGARGGQGHELVQHPRRLADDFVAAFGRHDTGPLPYEQRIAEGAA